MFKMELSYASSRIGTFLRAESSWHFLKHRAELELSYAPSWVGTFFLWADDIVYLRTMIVYRNGYLLGTGYSLGHLPYINIYGSARS